jgi:hypothetical protein
MKMSAAETDRLPFEEQALMAMQAAVRKALEEHARAGRPVYIWEDGRVVELSPEEIWRRLAAEPKD